MLLLLRLRCCCCSRCTLGVARSLCRKSQSQQRSFLARQGSKFASPAVSGKLRGNGTVLAPMSRICLQMEATWASVKRARSAVFAARTACPSTSPDQAAKGAGSSQEITAKRAQCSERTAAPPISVMTTTPGLAPAPLHVAVAPWRAVAAIGVVAVVRGVVAVGVGIGAGGGVVAVVGTIGAGAGVVAVAGPTGAGAGAGVVA